MCGEHQVNTCKTPEQGLASLCVSSLNAVSLCLLQSLACVWWGLLGMWLGEHGLDTEQRYHNRAKGVPPDRISFPTVVSLFCFKIKPYKSVK